jgi:hypothetical protein
LDTRPEGDSIRSSWRLEAADEARVRVEDDGVGVGAADVDAETQSHAGSIMPKRVMASVVHPCPCCGHLVFDDPPGSYDICPICFWEDDQVQLRWPSSGGGANRLSLIDSQHNYQQFGAIEERFTNQVRSATADEPLDPGWRAIAPTEVNVFEATGTSAAPWPADLTTLYWWRPTFWRLPSE